MTTNHDMKKIFSAYGIPFLIMFILELVLLYIYPKVELHLLLNSRHTDLQDTFFKSYSTLAEWPLYVLGLLPLCWKKYRLTIFYAVSEIVSGSITLFLKALISSERPMRLIDLNILPVVEGVDLHHSDSFPSGHACTFFVFFTCLALLFAYWYQQRASLFSTRKKILMYLVMFTLFLLAALGAFSRVYLSQHFLSDICVGGLIGFVGPCVIFYFGQKIILKQKTE